MFEKNMRYGFLLDAYGEVIDEHSRAVMTAYYEDDLSLAEIAEGEGISRQGVRHIIKKCEEELDALDSALHLGEKEAKLERFIGELRSICSELRGKNGTDAALAADRIEDIINGFLQ